MSKYYPPIKDGFYCLEHKVFFKDKCSKCNPHPLISNGNARMFRVGVGFEQGVEQGVTSFTRKGSVHSHAFRFVVLLPSGLKGWGSRDSILKSKGFTVVRKAGVGKVFMSNCFGFKCWFADKSITIYFPSWKRYFVDEARFGYNFAISDLKDLLVRLESVFGVSFVQDGKYVFKVAGQHHGLINNSLARFYTRSKKKLEVYDKGGELWLLVDNSNPEGFGLNELESVHSQTAIRDSDKIIASFFNDLRDNPSYLPSVSKNIIDTILGVQERYAIHIEKHLKVQDKTLDTLNQMESALRDIRNFFSQEKNHHVCFNRHNISDDSSENVKERELSPDSLIVSPSPLTISKFDDDRSIRLKRIAYYKKIYGW